MKKANLNCSGDNSAGFTLVELMIVIFILGLMAGAVILTLPSQDRVIVEDAERFAAKVAALRDNAIIQSRPMAVQVTVSGYSFAQRRKGNWETMQEKPFLSGNWSSGVMLGNTEAAPLLISFESTGLPSEPAQVILTFENQQQTIFINQIGDVNLDSHSVAAQP